MWIDTISTQCPSREGYLPDHTSKSRTAADQGQLNKTREYERSGPQTGRHGAVFPFRPSSAGRRAQEATAHSSMAEAHKTLAATQSTGASRAPSVGHGASASRPASHGHGAPASLGHAVESHIAPRPPRHTASQMEPIHMPPPPSYGRRAGSSRGSSAHTAAGAEKAHAPANGAASAAHFSPRGKIYHEFPLTHSSNWTFVGGFRP